jgi:LysW-gamma-L-lysine carboxypeptidase
LKNAYLANLATDMLIDMLKAYSPTGEEYKAIEILKEYAEALGYEEIYIDEVGNLVASYGSGDTSIAFIGHIDTVPGELPITFDGEKITGRGAIDAKGPLTALFIGASQARTYIDTKNFKIYSIAVVGEEGDSRGARNLISKGFKVYGSIIAEPSNNTGIVVGYRGSVKVKIQCSSRGGHTSSPMVENSACVSLIENWNIISKSMNEFKYDKNSSSLLYLHCGNNTRYNIYPRYGEMLIDIRVSVNESIESIIKFIEGTVNKFKTCVYSILDSTPPVKVTPNNLVVRSLMRAILKQGVKPRILYKLGTSDMNLLYPYVTQNIAAYGPGKSELSHSDKEEITVEELVHGINIYRGSLIELHNILYKAH